MEYDDGFEEEFPRTFTMERVTDETGVSGTGIVLEGAEWGDGRVTARWRGELSSLGDYKSFEEFLSIHVTSHPTNGSIIRFSDGTVVRQEGEHVRSERLDRFF